MRLRYVAVLALALSAACAGRQRLELEPDRAALSTVHRIYLASFGSADGSDLVREKVRVRLMNSGRFEVVDDSTTAHAILTGSAGLDTRTVRGTTDYAGIGLLRLIDARSHTTIWAHEYRRGFMFGGSVSTRVANQMVDQLLRDAGTGS